MQTSSDLTPDLQAYWRLLRQWLWLIVLAALLAGGTAYVVSNWFVEPVYSADAQVVIQPSSSVTGSDYSDIMAGQRAALTYAEMIQSVPLQEAALIELGYLDASGELSSNLPYELTIQPVRDTQIIEVQAESTDPAFAANFVNTLVDVFIEQNQERQSARYQDALQRLQEQMDGIEESIGQLKARLESTEVAEDRGQIEAQIIQLQDSLSRLAGAYQSIQVAELQAADLVSIVEPARVPRSPVRPRTLMNTLLAAVVGSMVAVGGVFLREYLDTSLRNPDEVEALSQSPVLGRIWFEEKIVKSNGTGQHGIVISHPLSLTAEAYRLLRTNLQFSSVDSPLKVMLVTSPGPSEGKSTVVYNLGLALAASGKHVIMIDADMRRPKLCEYAGVDRKPGLSDALVEHTMNLKEYLKPDPDMDDVWVLPPGQMPPNPTELLGSQRMSKLLDNFRKRDDVVVIIDSPPVLAAADAPVLAALVDGVLMVLEVGRTDRQMLIQAAEQIERSGTRLLGSVLNKVPMDGKGGYYYYYYYSDEDERGSIWPWRKQKRRRHEHAASKES